MAEPRLTTLSVAALATPALPMFAMMLPLIVFIPPFYVEHMGLGMAEVGAIIVLARVFDGITDPPAGIAMDRTQRWLSRKAWVVIGALPLLLATWQVFFAEAPGSASGLLGWLLVLYIGWTLMSVGLYSWAGQVSPDYHDRTRVMGAIQIANNFGTIGVLLIPALFEWLEITGDISVLRVRAMGAFVLIVVPIALLVAWLFAPTDRTAHPTNDTSLWLALRRAGRNTALLRLIGVDLMVGLKIGATSAISVFLIEFALQLHGRAGTMTLITAVSSLIAIPFFLKLAQRVAKHRVLVLNSLFAAVGGALVLFAPVGMFWVIALAYLLFGVSGGVSQLLVRSIMVDVADDDRQLTGIENSGLYFSFLTTTLKVGIAGGGALAFILADPAAARAGDNDALWMLRTIAAAWPITASAFMALLAWQFPNNHRPQRDTAARSS